MSEGEGTGGGWQISDIVCRKTLGALHLMLSEHHPMLSAPEEIPSNDAPGRDARSRLIGASGITRRCLHCEPGQNLGAVWAICALLAHLLPMVCAPTLPTQMCDVISRLAVISKEQISRSGFLHVLGMIQPITGRSRAGRPSLGVT